MQEQILNELFSLEGRVALVTGASGGIGREIAYGLAMAGAGVALSGRSSERIAQTHAKIRASGGKAIECPSELRELGTIDPLIKAVAASLGPIDILVNCAGINRREPVLDVTPDTYSEILDINLRTPYFLCQAVVPEMAKKGGGKIVNIGSLTTTWGVGNLSIYGMSKSAIGQMTRVMAVEWAQYNVQVNCICPGWIKTELTRPLWSDPERSKWILDRVPSGRPGTPEDLVGVSIYLSSPASNYTTGQTFFIDGGFLAGGQW